MTDPIKTEWVIARYTANSAHGKSVLAHIGTGVGYYLLNPTRAKTDDLIVGFKRAVDDARPNHLQLATFEQAGRLQKLAKQRSI